MGVGLRGLFPGFKGTLPRGDNPVTDYGNMLACEAAINLRPWKRRI